MRRVRGRAWGIVPILGVAACHLDPKTSCVTDADCLGGDICVAQECTRAGPQRDSSVEPQPDSAADAPADGRVDAQADGDAKIDGTIEAQADGRVEARADGNVDEPPDDGEDDTTMDADCDAGTDPFPSTAELDDFADASFANWAGVGLDSYVIADGGLIDSNGGDPLFWKTSFGSDQEAYATLQSYDPRLYRMSLLLYAPVTTGDNPDSIYVSYNAAEFIAIGAQSQGGTPTLLGDHVNHAVYMGERLGVRIRAGCIAVYVGTELVATRAASSNTSAQSLVQRKSGYIGVYAELDQAGDQDAMPAVWAHFGGGTLP